MITYFFAPLGHFKAAGMFTLSHLFGLCLCVILLAIFIKKDDTISSLRLQAKIRRMAWLLTFLELMKIGYNLYYGYTWLDAWFPLSFCSLFIYATWMSGYGKGIIKKAGDAFIMYGCLVGGVGFLLFPTTSLMNYPIWHFLCLYSLFFHSLMIYIGSLYCIQRNTIHYKYYGCYFLLAAIISILMNESFGTNMMILREPYNIPFKSVQLLYQMFPRCYTLFAILIYLLIPLFVTLRLKKTRFFS